MAESFLLGVPLPGPWEVALWALVAVPLFALTGWTMSRVRKGWAKFLVGYLTFFGALALVVLLARLIGAVF